MIIGKINDKVLIDDLVFREKEPKEMKWLSGGRQQGKTYQLIKDQQKEIERLNKENKELYESIEKAICYLANCDWNNKEFYDLYEILIGEDKDE